MTEPYRPPILMANGHIQTIYPSLIRQTDPGVYTRERIDTWDGDFLDLDWACRGESRLAIISHGLEGDSHRAYVTNMARAFIREGWDALAWNYRSCSGEPNRLLRSYHNSATDDLDWVIRNAEATGRYRMIVLVGFSLGGNLTLVHLGRDRVNPLVKGAAVFSVPCDLAAGATQLERVENKLYMKRFLRLLHAKIRDKMAIMPGEIDDDGYEKIKTFREFDDRYTAPIHGFRDAMDYWKKSSSLQYIKFIRIPTLIVNAANDPFLTPSCFPVEEAAGNPEVLLETPCSGGHVGFISFNREGLYWSERRAVAFLNRVAV